MHQVGTSSLLIYMMHGHTYIKFTCMMCEDTRWQEGMACHKEGLYKCSWHYILPVRCVFVWRHWLQAMVLIITVYPAVKLPYWVYPMTCLFRRRGEGEVYFHPIYRLALGGGGWLPNGSTPISSQMVGCFECGNECDCNFLLECCVLQCGINLPTF